MINHRVVLDLKDSLEDRAKFHGSLLQTGDVGVVVKPHSRLKEGWVVNLGGTLYLLFTDELKEYEDVICPPCRKRADMGEEPGCGESCGLPGCFCQHRGRPTPEEPSSGS